MPQTPTPAGSAPAIRHDPGYQRFVTEQDGHTAEIEYRMSGGTMEITHTGVPEPIGGRGIAGLLVRAVFEHAREHGMKVRPLCSYAAAWAERHPEVADLIA